jgi:UrcA family protein
MDTILPVTLPASTTLSSPKRPVPGISGAVSAILTASVFVVLTGVASAQTTTAPAISESVSHSDLDLTTTDGAKALLKRLDRAARRVCGTAPGDRILQPEAAAFHDQCVRNALDSAVAVSGAPLVIAMHAGLNQLAAR